jgi:hypothetical protein
VPVGDDGGAVPGAVAVVGEGELVGVVDGVAERECRAGAVDDLEAGPLDDDADGDGAGRAAGVRLRLAAGDVVRAAGRSAAGVGRRTR